MDLAQSAGAAWLDGQGARAGFAVSHVDVTAYRVIEPPGQGRRWPRFGVLDLEGVIEVTDPALFLPRLCKGFGRANPGKDLGPGCAAFEDGDAVMVCKAATDQSLDFATVGRNRGMPFDLDGLKLVAFYPADHPDTPRRDAIRNGGEPGLDDR